MDKIWNTYFNEIRNIGVEATEHTYRTSFENLLNILKQKSSINIYHEPKREKGFGAPDFRIESHGAIIGYIETKKLDENLDRILKTKQIKRYLSFTPNLIITNYHDFILIKENDIIERCSLFYLTDLESKKSKLKDNSIILTNKLFHKFFISETIKIGNAQELATQLASRGKILKEYILEILRNKEKDNFSQKISGLKNAFIDTLVEDLSDEEFADAYAQTVLYGFFLAFLQSGKKVSIEDASRLIPVNFEVIKEFFNLINDYNLPPHIRWIFIEIVNLINNINLQGIYKSISFKIRKETGDADPYLYFYETFLKKFDEKKRKSKGVYYTPISVVKFITHSINEILVSKFNKEKGFADSSVTVLDFATGTGTFLVSIFELIFDKICQDTGSFKSIVRDHILKNFFGFEYLVAPYAICHLKLSQLLKDSEYKLTKNERFQVFLTDTLDDTESKVNLFMPVLSKEGKQANKIKKKEKILVVTGNPPYNNKSRNNKQWILNLIKDYKPTDEKKLNLNDDYIKFIRYAHWKMQQNTQGIIGIITNNSFLNGLTHRRMRNTLLEEFDEIYILNLHGSSRQLETTPDGSLDQNVFDIMQGVSINIFIKNGKSAKEPQVFYFDLFGSRKNKDKFLFINTINSMMKENLWHKLDIEDFNQEFRKTKWGKNRFIDNLSYFDLPKNTEILKRYGEYWGITDIFQEYNSCIQTKRDSLAIKFNIEELKRVLSNFKDLSNEEIRGKYNLPPDGRDWTIQKAKESLEERNFHDRYITEIIYRPFDIRITYYVEKSKGFIAYPRHRTMQHFIEKENLGLIFMRQVVLNAPYTHFLVSDKISDLKLLRSSEGTNFVAPLYIYQDFSNNHDLFQNENSMVKRVNFTKDFISFIKSFYTFNPTPEEILGYIYAICHSQEYRETYIEFLNIDFPRIPFTKNQKLFKNLSKLGLELINHHLIKKTYPNNKIFFKGKSNDQVDNVMFLKTANSKKGKIYINKKQFYDNVPFKVWKFQVGGYPVLDSWLKSRKGRILNYQEQQLFKKIANILLFTIYQMDKIDSLYNEIII